jgi:hypothetical protein
VPYLRFKGFDEGILRQQLPVLVKEFALTAAVPEEIVKVELLPIVQITATPSSLEIFMFRRDQQKHDAIAGNLHELLSRFGYGNVHIFFVILTPSLYYKQGRPLTNISWLPEYIPPGTISDSSCLVQEI